MDFFHIIIDTSVLHDIPFGSPTFGRLIKRVQQGIAKVYIPLIALEERRTQLVDDHLKLIKSIRSNLDEMGSSQLGMLIQGLPVPAVFLPSKEDIDNNSYNVLAKYLADNKIEVIPITIEHANGAWERYFSIKPPFDPTEDREDRRKDIPDSWILEAALEIKNKALPGRHCMLIRDDRLETALKNAGFEIWKKIHKLEEEIERTTAVEPIRTPAPPAEPVPIEDLRNPDFENTRLIVLGINAALDTPNKTALFDALESIGINREIAEHEAKTLVLLGVLQDIGNHFIPANRAQASQALAHPLVQETLLKLLV